MRKKDTLKVFEDSTIRTVWDSDIEKWYMSIVDVISVLTESTNPQVYWRVLKKRLLEEGNQTVTICNGLKMLSTDEKWMVDEQKMKLTNQAKFTHCLPVRRNVVVGDAVTKVKVQL